MTSLLVRNIARIAGIERHGRLMLAGRDLSVMESIDCCQHCGSRLDKNLFYLGIYIFR